MRSLLIITDVFPPLAGAGTKRILKFAKFLPEEGWKCTVLTAANERFLPLDPSLVAEVPPATPVVRTFTFESWFRGGADPAPASREDGLRGTAARRGLFRLALGKTYKFLGQFLRVPDSRILWLPSAVTRGVLLCRRRRFDAILATGPSFTNFLIGAWIKVFTATPLLLDVRDAWVADPTRRFPRAYQRRLDALCERFAFKRANRVVTTNPYVTQDFARRYPTLAAAACDTIYNGFDRDDFAFLTDTPPAPNQPFTIVHTGRLYAERTPRHFLRALGRALQLKPEMRAAIRVQFVGSCEIFDDGKRIEDYIVEYGLEGAVEIVGRVSRKRSLQYQLEADLLLLIIGIVPPAAALTYGISGKLFDYAVCNKGILTIAGAGATRELIVANRFGDIFAHEDTAGIRDHLIRTFTDHAAGRKIPGPSPEALLPFECRALVRQLSEHLAHMTRSPANRQTAPSPRSP